MKDDILKVITTHYPYPIDTVMYVYDKTKSFDKTIMILNFSSTNAVSVHFVMENINQYISK